MASDTRYSQCDCKIGRNIDEYGLERLDEELRRRRRDEEASLRDLAAFTNRRLLEAALETATPPVLEDDGGLFGALGRDEAVGAIYEALDDDGTPSDRRARVRTRLERAGIDVDELARDWVTHPTVRTHLRECLDIDTSATRQIEPEDALDTIEWARSRCVAIVERTLERLQAAEELSIADVDVAVSIRVTCTSCGESYPPAALLSRGRCACYRGTGASEGSDPKARRERTDGADEAEGDTGSDGSK